MSNKNKFLKRKIEQINIKNILHHNFVEIYKGVRGVAGDIADATDIFERMLNDKNCTISLSLAGSSSAQGLLNVWSWMVKNGMVDVVLATGASITDMDLFETLGFKHYHGSPNLDNEELGKAKVDRIYDVLISEDELKKVDSFCEEFLNTLNPGVYPPWKILRKLGKHLHEHPEITKKSNSLIETCYREGVPLFCLGLSDSAFGMGSVSHQVSRSLENKSYVTIDTTPEYTDLAKIKLISPTTGLFMIGGGVPKNHLQDTVITAQTMLNTLRNENQTALLEKLNYSKEISPNEVPLHKYAIQITVADPRDGACSSSTLEEARSWGKVDLNFQKMVYAEATLAVPLIVSHLYQKNNWKNRKKPRYADWLASLNSPADFGDLEKIIDSSKKAN